MSWFSPSLDWELLEAKMRSPSWNCYPVQFLAQSGCYLSGDMNCIVPTHPWLYERLGPYPLTDGVLSETAFVLANDRGSTWSHDIGLTPSPKGWAWLTVDGRKE